VAQKVTPFLFIIVILLTKNDILTHFSKPYKNGKKR